MNELGLIFVPAGLIIVPLGYRLLETAAPGYAPPAATRVGMIVAGALLAVGFLLPPGLAAVCVVPWVVLTSMTALVGAWRLVTAPDRWRPGPQHAVVAALGFLAVGAVFALADRLGVRPFGFSTPVIALTAVHFLFAGFVLPLAGALADMRRPRPWVKAATAAVIVGIPTTALGFFGFPIANWFGAVMTASGGFAIGLATIDVARTFATPASRLLGVIAGASLLLSMPLAIVYATGTAVGSAWLSIGWMAMVHGTLNAVGFALSGTVAWTLERRATAPSEPPARRPPRSASSRWAIGLVTGLTVGVGILVTGPLAGALGILALILLAIEPDRDAPIGGLFVGGGVAWVAVFGTAQARCGAGCVYPDLTPWLVAAAAMLAIGLILSWHAAGRRDRPSTRTPA